MPIVRHTEAEKNEEAIAVVMDLSWRIQLASLLHFFGETEKSDFLQFASRIDVCRIDGLTHYLALFFGWIFCPFLIYSTHLRRPPNIFLIGGFLYGMGPNIPRSPRPPKILHDFEVCWAKAKRKRREPKLCGPKSAFTISSQKED